MIACVKQHESQPNVSHGNGVPESAICGWLRDKKVAWFYRCGLSHSLDEKKKDRIAKVPQLEKAAFTWFVKERQAFTLIGGPLLSIKAQNLPNDTRVYNPSDSGISRGWLHCFQHCSVELETTKSDWLLQKWMFQINFSIK